MAQETLRITLTADNKQALASLRETVTSLNGVATASGKAGTAVAKTGKDFTGLSRVIQDLPYGINGISNNLTQLLPAAGAAGLVLSGLVTALTFASIGFGAWTRGLNGATKATDEFKKSVDDAAAGAAKEGLQLQAYITIARDQTKSLAERNRALFEANKLYGDHGEKLTLVNIETEKVTNAVNGYTEALIKNAVASKFGDKLAESYIKQYNAAKDLEKAEKDLKRLREGPTATNAAGALVPTALVRDAGTLRREAELQKEIGGLTKVNAEAQKEYNSQLSFFNGIMSDLIITETKYGKVQKETSSQTLSQFDRINIVIGEMIRKRKEWQALNRGKMDLAPIGSNTEGLLSGVVGAPNQIGGMGKAGQQIGQALANQGTERQLSLFKELIDVQTQQAMTVTNLVTPAFDSLFSAMANGESIGESLLNSFKQIAIQLTSMVIKALLFKAILSALKLSNPITAGLDIAGNVSGGISGGFNILGLLRGQDLQLMLERTNTGMGYRRGR